MWRSIVNAEGKKRGQHVLETHAHPQQAATAARPSNNRRGERGKHMHSPPIIIKIIIVILACSKKGASNQRGGAPSCRECGRRARQTRTHTARSPLFQGGRARACVCLGCACVWRAHCPLPN